jgi:hypothetical protein
VLADPAFQRGEIHTGYLEEFMSRRVKAA